MVSNAFSRTLLTGCYPLDRLVEHALEVSLRERGALQVLHGLDLLGHLHRLLVLDRCHLSLPKLLADFRIVSEIELRADEDDGDAGCVMLDFGVPLFAD